MTGSRPRRVPIRWYLVDEVIAGDQFEVRGSFVGTVARLLVDQGYDPRAIR